MHPEQINWDDPNLDLDKVLGIPDIDKEFDFGVGKNVKNILDIKLKEDFNEEIFSLYDGKDLLGVVEYTREKEGVHIDFIASSNGDISKIVADREFRTKFEEYFTNSKEKINGLGRDLLNRFIKKLKSGDILTLVPVEGSEGFYEKAFSHMQNIGKISIIEKSPEYKILVL